MRVPLADVIGRSVKLTRKGHEHSGLCPFHSEKTPSFTVSDEKGFYHCFGCGAHGDVIRFVMESEHLSFPETVERLAGEAGLDVPRLSPEEEEAHHRRLSLYDLMEAAAAWFESRLSADQGAGAREYIDGRKLTAETIAHFRLGFGPNSRSALKEAMLARKFTIDQIVEAGLVIRPEDNPRETYDRFRNRIMFPICDARGRVVAFGGRALGDAGAKYLNSPETPLFHKGHMLYNFASARKPSIDKMEAIVVEGYMDVIALHQAGFPNAVAPLGTALTEDQIALLWRLAPEPTLCFDGDRAGVAAAGKALDRALPLLKPGHSLRFAMLPEGEDPDSLVMASAGASAFQAVLNAAIPLSAMMWNLLTGSVDTSTPERRAGLEKRVFDALRPIADEKVRSFYQREFRSRLFERFRPEGASLKGRFAKAGRAGRGGRQGRNQGGGWQQNKGHAPGGVDSGRLGATQVGRNRGEGAARINMEELLVLTVLNHPEILIVHQEDLAALQIVSPELARLRNALLEGVGTLSPLDREGVKNHLVEKGFEALYTRLTESDAYKSDWSARSDVALADAEISWLQVLKRYRRVTELQQELKALEEELVNNTTEEGFERLRALQLEIEANAGNEADLDGYGLASGRSMNY